MILWNQRIYMIKEQMLIRRKNFNFNKNQDYTLIRFRTRIIRLENWSNRLILFENNIHKSKMWQTTLLLANNSYRKNINNNYKSAHSSYKQEENSIKLI